MHNINHPYYVASRPIFQTILLGLLLLSGCATTGKVWYQPNHTPAQAYQDLTDCKSQARAALDPHGISGFMRPAWGRPKTDVFVDDCMRAKGWQPTPAAQVPNASQYPRP